VVEDCEFNIKTLILRKKSIPNTQIGTDLAMINMGMTIERSEEIDKGIRDIKIKDIKINHQTITEIEKEAIAMIEETVIRRDNTKIKEGIMTINIEITREEIKVEVKTKNIEADQTSNWDNRILIEEGDHNKEVEAIQVNIKEIIEEVEKIQLIPKESRTEQANKDTKESTENIHPNHIEVRVINKKEVQKKTENIEKKVIVLKIRTKIADCL
jgi:hypothetical protein